MENYAWTCPHCNRDTTITEQDRVTYDHYLGRGSADGRRVLTSIITVCPNPKCRKLTIVVEVSKAEVSTYTGSELKDKLLQTWQLIPSSKAKPFPDYIPQAILNDYNEACLIKDLSPKASATLARRCLQGIIRNYWKVKPGKLANEIDQIRDKIEMMTWEAIDAVRSVGNIGAHMEKDVNLIVDIEPKEAELLISLIETLLKDWYIARYDKESRLQELIELGKEKNGAGQSKKAKKVDTKQA